MGTITKGNFEWDEEKNAANIAKHGISFVQACHIFERYCYSVPIPSTVYGEERVQATGLLDDVEVTVIYTWRGYRRRIISTRRARKNERECYW